MIFNGTHLVAEEEEATEEAEEVGGEQREVDGGGTGHLHHDGHEAVQRVHAQDVDGKQRGCRSQLQNLSVGCSNSVTQMMQKVNLQIRRSHFIAATALVSSTALKIQPTQT